MASSRLRFFKVLLVAVLGCAQAAAAQGYSGLDRNDFPGDAAMAALRQSFAYTGYWLSPPPGEQANSWAGRREFLRKLGYGFLLLANGRLDAALAADAARLGHADGVMAAAAAQHEGFPAGAILFLDQEEGGRLTARQAAYIGAWIEAVSGSRYRPGVYASAIDVPDGPGRTISTARDLRARFPSLPLWAANDQCPPAPGCRLAALPPATSGLADAVAWQYAQSPRRTQFTAQCRASYAAEGNCYAPHGPAGVFLDLNTARSADPSHGR